MNYDLEMNYYHSEFDQIRRLKRMKVGNDWRNYLEFKYHIICQEDMEEVNILLIVNVNNINFLINGFCKRMLGIPVTENMNRAWRDVGLSKDKTSFMNRKLCEAVEEINDVKRTL